MGSLTNTRKYGSMYITMKCPECKSQRLNKFGTKFVMNKELKVRERKQQYQCQDCGRVTIKPIEE